MKRLIYLTNLTKTWWQISISIQSRRANLKLYQNWIRLRYTDDGAKPTPPNQLPFPSRTSKRREINKKEGSEDLTKRARKSIGKNGNTIANRRRCLPLKMVSAASVG